MSDTRKPMTQEELAEIRELAEAATPGPWYGCFEPKENMIEARGAKWVMGLSPVSCPFTESLIETCGEDVISSFECPKQVLISTDDFEYMVAANPKTVLALLDEVKRLRKERDWLLREVSQNNRMPVFCPMPDRYECLYHVGRECKSREDEMRVGCWRTAVECAVKCGEKSNAE